MNSIQTQIPAEHTDCTSHLSQWYHCSNMKNLPDDILAQAWHTSKCVSFVFHHRSQKQQTSEPTSVDLSEDNADKDLSPSNSHSEDDQFE